MYFEIWSYARFGQDFRKRKPNLYNSRLRSIDQNRSEKTHKVSMSSVLSHFERIKTCFVINSTAFCLYKVSQQKVIIRTVIRIP